MTHQTAHLYSEVLSDKTAQKWNIGTSDISIINGSEPSNDVLTDKFDEWSCFYHRF